MDLDVSCIFFINFQRKLNVVYVQWIENAVWVGRKYIAQVQPMITYGMIGYKLSLHQN